MPDRYLVTMKGPLSDLEDYLKIVLKRDESLRRDCVVPRQTFPQLKVLYVKSFPKTTEEFDIRHIFIDVSAIVYAPVNMHTLLKASITSSVSTETKFFGANILPDVERRGPWLCERISELTLGKTGSIRWSHMQAVFPTESEAVSTGDLDFHLWLQFARMIDGRPNFIGSQRTIKETFKAFLSAIPPQKPDYEMCQLKLQCLTSEFDTLCTVVSATCCPLISRSTYTRRPLCFRFSLRCNSMSKSR